MMTTLAAIALAATITPVCSPEQPQPELFEVSAYSPTCDADSPFHDGFTAMMVKADPALGIVATDPRVIPMFSRVWIEDLGWYIAVDTGGLIKGNRIDVLMATRAEALRYGRRPGQLVFVLPPKGSWKENRQIYNELARLRQSHGPEGLENVEFAYSPLGMGIALLAATPQGSSQ